MHEINICWFKKDLRVVDNEALYKASKDYDVLPIYILKNKRYLCCYLEVAFNKAIRLIMKRTIKVIVKGEKLDIYVS